MIYRFETFELDDARFALFRDGSPVVLEPKALRVLLFFVRNPNRLIRKQELLDTIWLDTAVSENALTRSITLLRKALEDSSKSPRFIETVPTAGYRFLAAVQEIDDTPAESAVLEPAPEPPAPASVLPPAQANRSNRFALALACVALLIAVVGWRMKAASRETRAIHSLAVLPLDNLSGDSGQEYLADGMTDELTTMLARDSSLRVVSRTTVMQFKGARRPLSSIAREIGVDAVIEGSLARSGTRIHVTLQLIRAETDSHLWAQSYDRDVNDPTVPDEAARSIAQYLNSIVNIAEPVQTINPEAHDAFLRGRYLWPTNRMEESGAYFRKATEIQPDYAEAWAGLADFYGEGIAAGVLDPRSNIHLEEEAAQRALTLAPNRALSHRAVAAAYLIDHWDAKSADREVLLAISMDPSDAESFYFRANVLEALDRFPEAIQVEKKSMEMDPFERREALASIYLYARMYDEALADIQLRLETAPNDTALLDTAAQAWRSKGNYEQAMKFQAQLLTAAGDPQAAADLRRAYALGGARGLIQWQLARRLKEAKTSYVSPVQLASYYAQLGDKEHALSLLEEGYRQRSTDMLWVPDEPEYDFLHGESRYQAVVQHLADSPIP